jgi:hypothetical protein
MIRNLTTLCARTIVTSRVPIDNTVATADAIEIINDFEIEYDKMSLARTFNMMLEFSSDDEPSGHSEDCSCDECDHEPVPDFTLVRREIKDKRLMRFLHHVIIDHSNPTARQNMLEIYDLTSLCYSRDELVVKKSKILRKIRDYGIAEEYLNTDRTTLF